jgi:hypothetical protein
MEINRPFCAGPETSPQWFALYTTPRHEKHVLEMLAQRQIETFLPLYRTTRRWKKSRRSFWNYLCFRPTFSLASRRRLGALSWVRQACFRL